MEWFEWVFAFCGASMAVATAVMSTQIYAIVKERGRRGPGTRL